MVRGIHGGSRRDVVAAYDRWAATYDVDRNRTRDLAAAVLPASGLDPTGRRVLEIGCGTGRNTGWLAARARQVVAADFSPGMLRAARARAPHVQLVRFDVCVPWPIAAASVDVVIAVLVLEHVEDLAPVFAEARRVLARDGEAFVCELHPLRQLAGRQAEFSPPDGGEPTPVPAFLHDASDYVNAGLRAALDLVEMCEWRDPDSSRHDRPRLLSLHFRTRRDT
jgi:ubiquinone/menaquinone biosynthesis C-methylase UbiE